MYSKKDSTCLLGKPAECEDVTHKDTACHCWIGYASCLLQFEANIQHSPAINAFLTSRRHVHSSTIDSSASAFYNAFLRCLGHEEEEHISKAVQAITKEIESKLAETENALAKEREATAVSARKVAEQQQAAVQAERDLAKARQEEADLRAARALEEEQRSTESARLRVQEVETVHSKGLELGRIERESARRRETDLQRRLDAEEAARKKAEAELVCSSDSDVSEYAEEPVPAARKRRAKIGPLRKEIKDLKTQLQAQTNRCEALKTQVSEWQLQADDQQAEIVQLTASEEALQAELDRTRSDTTEELADMRLQKDEWHQKWVQVEEDFNLARAANESLTTALNKAEAAKTELKALKKKLLEEERKPTIKRELSVANTQTDVMIDGWTSDQVAEHRAIEAKLRKDLDCAGEARDDLESAKASAGAQVQQLMKETIVLRSSLSKLGDQAEERSQALQLELQTLKSTQNPMSVSQDAQKSLEQVQDEVRDLKLDLRDAEEEITSTQEQLEAAQIKLEAAQDELFNKTAFNQDLSEMIQKKNVEIRELKRQVTLSEPPAELVRKRRSERSDVSGSPGSVKRRRRDHSGDEASDRRTSRSDRDAQ